jgi:thiamine biosynthesis lipoprotein
MRFATDHFPLWGGTATLLVSDPEPAPAARSELDRTISEVDLACSAYRDDSELARLGASEGHPVQVSPMFHGILSAALDAAHATGGLVNPVPRTPGAWQDIRLLPDLFVAVPTGVRLDLGAIGKAYAADLAAARAAHATGCGVLVSLAGDLAVAGPVPAGGWPVRVAHDHRLAPDGTLPPGQDITLEVAGGLATSSLSVRTRTIGGTTLTHIVDPRSGMPVRGPWRTVSVAAGSCVDANTASTGAIVRGYDAPAWLAAQGLAARLVHADGFITTVAGWPADVDWPGVKVAG